jgi:outer membrane usher protein
VNINRWVLEQKFSFEDKATVPWLRRETQLVKDNADTSVRWNVGDINFSTRGLMGNRTVSGLSIRRLFNLKPYDNQQPVRDYRLFLAEDSQVEIYSNDILRKKIALPAGNHELIDLPLFDGFNQIRLHIKDRFNKERDILLDYNQDLQLLAPNVSDFLLVAGVVRETNNEGEINYFGKRPIFSLFYQQGLSNDFTIGGHLEIDKNVVMAGHTGLWNGVLGRLDYDVGVSSDVQSGGGVLLDYQLKKNNQFLNLRLSGQTEYFANISQRATDVNLKYNYNVSFSPQSYHQWLFNISYNNSQNWHKPKSDQFQLSFSRLIFAGSQFRLNISQVDDSLVEDLSFNMQLSHVPAKSRFRSRFNYSSLNQSKQLDFELAKIAELGNSASLSLSESENQQASQIKLERHASKYQVRLNMNQSHPVNGSQAHDEILSFSTAMVYVNDQVAISRPLAGNSFALFKTKNNIEQGSIGLMRGGGSSVIDQLNGSDEQLIVPNLGNYLLNRMVLNIENLPLDVVLQQLKFDLLPTYRSGFYIEVGSEERYFARGQLYDKHRQPIALVMGTIQSLQFPEQEPLVFFTNRQGMFELEGVKIGQYELMLEYPKPIKTNIIIKKTDAKVIDLGHIMVGD